MRLIVGDALECPLEDASVDCVISSFGLKTCSQDQLASLAREIARVLRPGGAFSLFEISVPRSALIRVPYLAYVSLVIPVLGRLLLGNPDNYRLLAVYTKAFGSCRTVIKAFETAGLDVTFRSYFWGCATGLSGRKPRENAPAALLSARTDSIPRP